MAHDDDRRPDATPSRRSLLAWLGALPALAAAIPALRAVLSTAKLERPDRLPLCRFGELPAEPGELIRRNVVYRARRGPTVEKIAETVFVGREADGSVYAMSGTCTHVGCPVSKADDERPTAEQDGEILRCPCHNGLFDLQGNVLDGPPPAPLRRLDLVIPEDADDETVIEVTTP